MRKRIWAVLLASAAAYAQTAELRSVTIASGGDRRSILVAERTGRIHWSGGAVRGYFHYNGAPVIWSIDRSGRNEDFILRGSSHVQGVWAAPDGTLAVIGGNWLSRISPDHSQVKEIELGGWFTAQAVAVTGDGRMWVIGRQITKREVGFDRDIVLKGFNPDGSLSSSHIIRLRVPRNGSQWDYEDRALSRSTLAAAGSRIAWLTSFGQYIEFAPGGQQVVYVEPPEDLEFEIDKASLALSPSGETFLAMNVQDVCVLSWLDRRTRKWIPVQFEGDELEAGSRLLGFDGNDLMALDAGLERGGFLTRLRRR